MKINIPKNELNCVIGNLFEGLEPPCDNSDNDIVIRWKSFTGEKCTLIIRENYCEFYGNEKDIDTILNSKCPERHRYGGKCKISSCK